MSIINRIGCSTRELATGLVVSYAAGFNTHLGMLEPDEAAARVVQVSLGPTELADYQQSACNDAKAEELAAALAPNAVLR